jgi:hypothetical protein
VRAVWFVASAFVLSASAQAAPPVAGVLVPGESLGGLRLGATKAQVERAWGRAYGRCTGCREETWYFNYYAFQPRGAGVEFRDGRASAIFTLYQPPGWETDRGLALGEPESRVNAMYPRLDRHDCGDYHALVQRRGRTVSALYVLDDRLWAFGLSRPGAPLCRR